MIKGQNGKIDIQEENLVLIRTGMGAKLSRQSVQTRTIPLAAITDVDIVASNMIKNGRLRFGVGGEPLSALNGSDAVNDPNTVVFTHQQRRGFEQLAHADGSPLRPQWVLDQLRRRTAELGLPRIGLHNLRHTAATIMISSGIPLAIVSKTLRLSTLSTTLNTYGHLLAYAARGAVSALGAALDHADHDSLTTPASPLAA